MLPNFQVNLQKYAELLVRVGLNLQPKQRLLIYAPLASASLVHQVAAIAYQNGAPLMLAREFVLLGACPERRTMNTPLSCMSAKITFQLS